MRNKIALTLGLVAAIVTTAALAVIGPTQPGDYVYYRDDNNEVVGQAWIACYSSEIQEWGIRTANAVKTHMTCPPPQD
jgi:Family of unknown function (DUF6289)